MEIVEERAVEERITISSDKKKTVQLRVFNT